MISLPNMPFTTRDFSPDGGGIDFLGLRWVNLTMVGRDLIPELNNVTTDMGTFFLGAWIPWKFQQLCGSEKDYTEKNFQGFREKVEVAFSLTFNDAIDIEREFGQARNRIGSTQKIGLPGRLTFEKANRKKQNSLYAAAIYGPSLTYLGFIKSYRSQAKGNGKPLNISMPGDHVDILEILNGVDKSLKKAKSYNLLASLDSPQLDAQAIRKLAEAGLDPARFRAPDYAPLKACFRRMLLPKESTAPGYARTLTTRLLLATLRQRNNLALQDIRDTWYTGMFDDGKPISITSPELEDHRQRWSCFMARQYQRHAIELFLWCFEEALKFGNRSVDDIIEYWANRSKTAGEPLEGTFQTIAAKCAGPLLKKDEISTSQAWNKKVTASDERFEYVREAQGDGAVIYGLRMLAGWYWRMLVRQQDEKTKPLLNLGGADRMSMSWFLRWLTERKALPVRRLLKEIFSELIFAQHMRVALARFDGSTQRLRFLIGDSGIEPTVSARPDLGRRGLPWMPDRLHTLVSLLCDCDVLVEKDRALSLGPDAPSVK